LFITYIVDNNKLQNQEEKLQDTITSLNKQKIQINEEDEENIVDSLELPSPKHQINSMASFNENKLLTRGNSNPQQKWAVNTLKPENNQTEEIKIQNEIPAWNLSKDEPNMWNTGKNSYLFILNIF